MSHSIRAFTIGTASWDVVFDVRNLRELFNNDKGIFDGKLVSAHSYEQAGGSAINTRLGMEAVANAFGNRATVYTCTQLGESSRANRAKDYILDELGIAGINDKTIMDVAFGRDHLVPKNTIILNKNGAEHSGRAVIKGRPDKHTEPCPTIENQIDTAIKESQIAVLHSRDPELAMFAAVRAHALGMPVLFDCSEKDAKIVERLGPVLKIADYVLAPGDAMLPGMKKPDARELFYRLMEDYGCPNFAISDNSNPIQVYTRNRGEMQVPVHTVEPVDVLGAGDTRDAAMAYFLAMGQGFENALAKGSDIASFSVTQYGRDWVPLLAQHVRNSPLYGNDFFQQPQEQPGLVPVFA